LLAALPSERISKLGVFGDPGDWIADSSSGEGKLVHSAMPKKRMDALIWMRMGNFQDTAAGNFATCLS